jgi:hypothetical protein
MQQIAALPDNKAEEALNELRNKRTFIQRMTRRQLEVEAITAVHHKIEKITVLIESGSEGNCIDQNLVK